MFDYPITLEAFYTGSHHNYFGHKDKIPGSHPTHSPQIIHLVAGKGIKGDRFFDIKPDFDGQITFINAEVVDLIKQTQEAVCMRPINGLLFRRNVLLRGVNLIELIGKQFTIGECTFEGVKHCAPCKWMDIVMGQGAMRLMRGRGGLRARIIKGGQLDTSLSTLYCDDKLQLDPTDALPQIKLPG